MATKYMCIRQCYQANDKGQWTLFDVGQTAWYDKDPGKHWSPVPAGEPATAQEILRTRCKEIGITVDSKWDVPRLQREYDYKVQQMYDEQNKQIMASTVAEPDARVSNRVEEPKKRK